MSKGAEPILASTYLGNCAQQDSRPTPQGINTSPILSFLQKDPSQLTHNSAISNPAIYHITTLQLTETFHTRITYTRGK
jgi:hypothetical protein